MIILWELIWATFTLQVQVDVLFQMFIDKNYAWIVEQHKKIESSFSKYKKSPDTFFFLFISTPGSIILSADI